MFTRRSFLRTALLLFLALLPWPRRGTVPAQALDGSDTWITLHCVPKPIEGLEFPAFTGIRYCLDDSPVTWEYWDGHDWQLV